MDYIISKTLKITKTDGNFHLITIYEKQVKKDQVYTIDENIENHKGIEKYSDVFITDYDDIMDYKNDEKFEINKVLRIFYSNGFINGYYKNEYLEILKDNDYYDMSEIDTIDEVICRIYIQTLMNVLAQRR
jgi:hypothetical protein